MILLLRRAGFCLGAAFLLVGILFVTGATWLPRYDVADGVETQRIYILSNGFHSDIAVPVGMAAALGVEVEDFAVETNAIRYLAIGWGSVTAYTSLRAMSDLTVGIVARAAAFDTTVVHILPTGDLSTRDGIYSIDLTDEQLAQLIDRLARDFASTTPVPNLTQGFGDLFYRGHGRFSPWRTCNSWTGAHLRAIGVAVGFWTPSAWSLEYGLKRL